MFGPTDWKSLTEEIVPIHRAFACPLYEGCLNEAASQRWESFTCVFCSMAKGHWSNHDKEQREIPS